MGEVFSLFLCLFTINSSVFFLFLFSFVAHCYVIWICAGREESGGGKETGGREERGGEAGGRREERGEEIGGGGGAATAAGNRSEGFHAL